MNAAIRAKLTVAAAESEAIGGDSFTIAGDSTVYTGTFGDPVLVDIPNNAGGYNRQVQMTLNAKRAQFSADPAPKVKLTRASGGSGGVFNVIAVNTHDSFFYFFQLVKIGA